MKFAAPPKAFGLSALVLGFLSTPIFSAVDLGTYKTCTATDAQFKQTKLASAPAGPDNLNSNGVTKMDFTLNSSGSVDIYFVAKNGEVMRYSGKTLAVDQLGTIPVNHAPVFAFGSFGFSEQGLVGIAVDPNFNLNRQLFFDYSAGSGTDFKYQVTRITLKPDFSALDLTTEKVLIQIPASDAIWHTAGAMAFDAYGDLYVAIGDNLQYDDGPGNTADLRGGIMRIHPDNSAKGYSIPVGNFAEKFATYFTAQGKADIAAQYKDPTRVKPEIYVKGTRNAYTITLDPVRRWLTWGDVGPDQQQQSEEYNLVKAATFGGWPYFAGKEDMNGQRVYNGATVTSKGTRAEPLSGQGAGGTGGVTNLPPNTDPIFSKTESCAMTGPIFRYDGRLTHEGNFPPQLNRKWIIGDCTSKEFGFQLVTLSDAGDSVLTMEKVFDQFEVNTLIDLKQGPDGALYYVSWNNGIFRIDYTGTCKDASIVPETAGNTSIAKTQSLATAEFKIEGNRLFINQNGPYSVSIVDLNGKQIWFKAGLTSQEMEIPNVLKSGVYQIKMQSQNGISSRLLQF